jgi:aldehyde oxidoreductase
MRKKDGTFRTYDEMVAEKIPTLYKGVWSSVGLHVPNDPNTGVGDPMLDHNFHLSVCRVEVDTKTGNTDVIAFRAVADVGVIGNRLALLGQAYSGIEHSIGYATSEEYSDYDKKYETMIGCGTVQCNTMPDDCEFQFVETPRRDGPFGSGGASECFQSSPHAAVMNAIYNAIGVRFYECPITPDLIKKGLELKAQGKSLKPDKYFLGSDFDEALEEIKANPVKVQQGHGSGH